MNRYHEKELTHLVCERDRAELAGESKEVKVVEQRILDRYGYLTVSLKEHSTGPRLIK